MTSNMNQKEEWAMMKTMPTPFILVNLTAKNNGETQIDIAVTTEPLFFLSFDSILIFEVACA